MTLVEKILALKATPPFDGLRDNELALIASAALQRHFPAGETIHAGDEPLGRFHLLVRGSWESPAGPLPRTLGVASLLYDLPAPAVTAGAGGAECLVIARSHFHTVAAECPEVLIGYLTGLAADAPAS
ncbi:MAG TPA: cyclic nucleotide-binding domain-containing protein [Opitutus sp.]|nr:cyclic nucleotide-binding domain-containing protein [Opitutus sp.]